MNEGKVVSSPANLLELNALVIKYCCGDLVDSLRERWRVSVDFLSNEYGLARDDVWKQFVLHVPFFGEAELLGCNDNPPNSLINAVAKRLEKLSSAQKDYFPVAGVGVLSKDSVLSNIGGKLVSNPDGVCYFLDEVDRIQGEYIESRLHYMQYHVSGNVRRFGLFVSGYSWPIAMITVTRLDRSYKLCGFLSSYSLHDVSCASRIFGFGGLPKNSISILVSFAVRRLRLEEDQRFIITAINPIVGFSGVSILTSGFRPYALSPVGYGYTESGEYMTRRQQQHSSAKLSMPPNILFVRGMNSENQRLVIKIGNISVVSFDSHKKVELEDLRSHLENVWGSWSRYHRTIVADHDPVSKGQCGVTSAYIATALVKQGYEAMFCEGDVYFSDGTSPIKNHCWVKIPFSPDPDKLGNSYTNLIIDITADQTGFHTSVICNEDLVLKADGIDYQERLSKSPEEVNTGHVAERLGKLSEKLFNRGIKV